MRSWCRRAWIALWLAACGGAEPTRPDAAPPPPPAAAQPVASPSAGGGAGASQRYKARVVVGAPTPVGRAPGAQLGAGHAQHGQR